jgi:ethanolamine ammonia-lyase small subunit
MSSSPETSALAAPALTSDPWQALRAHTPARIALGRVGASQPTQALLAFGAAHAQARDAVHLPLDVVALTQRLQSLALPPAFNPTGLPVLNVASAAPDRASYLLRPDLGRRLSPASREALDALDSPPCDLLLVVGDGLSAAAVERQAVPFIERLLARCPAGWRLGPLVVATQARVALADEVGQRLHAGMVAMLIGERPGLSSPDSLGAYLTYAPRVGRSDAQRNCLSNIRPEGLGYDEAARKLWWLVTQAQRLGLSGVSLKDRSDENLLTETNSTAPQL